MLTYFAAENIFSINEKIELDLTVSPEDSEDWGWTARIDDENVATIAAIYGANASGKTNILKAISFLGWVAIFSQQEQKPETAFPFKAWFLNNHPTILECKFFDSNEKEIHYKISLNKKRILFEKLIHNQKEIYSRKLINNEDKVELFSSNLKGKFPLDSLRENASFLSFALSFNHLREVGKKFFPILFRDLKHHVPYRGFKGDKIELKKDFELISELDLGLSDIRIEKRENIGNLLFGEHLLPNGERVSIPFDEESMGTQSALLLARDIRMALKLGGILIVDELEQNLHPHIVGYFLDLFKGQETNPHKAQIIFTTHLPEIMDNIGAYNIFLTEKRDQATEIWRLDDIENLNRSESFRARYLQGAFGGTPRIGFRG